MMSPPHSWSFTRLAATRAFITRRFFWAAFSLLSTGTSTPQNPLLFLPVESAVEQTHTSVFLQSSQVGADRTLDGTQMGGGAVKIMPLWGCHSSEQHCGSLSSICLWPSGCWECCPSDNVLSTNDTWKQPWRQSERKIWIWTQRGERSGSLSIIWVAANRGQPWCTCSLNKRRNYLHEHNEKMFSHWWDLTFELLHFSTVTNVQ